MSEPVTIKLRKPITFGNRTVAELTIRPIKAKDLRRINDADSSMVQALDLASYLSGEVKQVIDELEGDDLWEVVAAVNGFFRDTRGTGKTSSES